MPFDNSSFSGGGEHVDSSSHVWNVLLQRLNLALFFVILIVYAVVFTEARAEKSVSCMQHFARICSKGHSVLHEQHFQKTRQARCEQGPIENALHSEPFKADVRF